jgi:hypothetical protein
MFSSYSFTTLALDGGEWSASRPGRALPPEKGHRIPIVQEARWAPEPVWTHTRGKIVLPLPGIEPRSPSRPARSLTLYWLSCCYVCTVGIFHAVLRFDPRLTITYTIPSISMCHVSVRGAQQFRDVALDLSFLTVFCL